MTEIELVTASLNNRYYLMRHGRSLANQAGLIVSGVSTGSRGWGLTSDAVPDILKSLELNVLPRETRIYSSPFLRTRETADIVSRACGCPPPRVAEGLRERFFGNLEGGSDKAYPEVWREDGLDAENRMEEVESPASVLARLIRVISDIESDCRGATVLLVSHGDPLNILLAHAAGIPANRHRDIRSMKTGEIRPLVS